MHIANRTYRAAKCSPHVCPGPGLSAQHERSTTNRLPTRRDRSGRGSWLGRGRLAVSRLLDVEDGADGTGHGALGKAGRELDRELLSFRLSEQSPQKRKDLETYALGRLGREV